MTVPEEDYGVAREVNGWWDADIEITRTPSPGMPAKRMKMTLEDIQKDFQETTMQKDSEYNNLLRLERGAGSLGYEAQSFKELWFTPNDSPPSIYDITAVPSERDLTARKRKKMQTGCIPCL